MTPELAHLIGQELADRLLKGQYEVVITTHLNTRHYHNHIVWNSVSMADGRKYHSNAKSYYTEIRKISDELCRKYGLSIIESDQKINPLCTVESGTGRETDMEKCDSSGYQGVCTGKLLLVTILKRNGKAWIHMETEPEICRFKGSGDGTVHPATVSWKNYSEEEIRGQILQPKVKRIYQKRCRFLQRRN